jgi:hypothetical protein
MSQMTTASLTHTKETELQIQRLQRVLPYPRTWYLGKSEKEVNGIYRRHVQSIAEFAIVADECEVREKVRKYHTPSKGGELHVISTNKKSFRFKYVVDDKERHGMVATYHISRYNKVRGGGRLPNGFVCVIWDNDKKSLYRIESLISFAVDRADNSIAFVDSLRQITNEYPPRAQ